MKQKRCIVCSKPITIVSNKANALRQKYCDVHKIEADRRKCNLVEYYRTRNKKIVSVCQCCNKKIISNRKRKYCDAKKCKLYGDAARVRKSYKKNYTGRSKIYKEKRRVREKKRWHTDIKYNLGKRMANGIRLSFLHPSSKDGCHWENMVEYNRNQLIERLQSTMPKGATWQDFLDGRLHIDHIKPKAQFIFNSHKDDDFKKCWALDNLQLLWAEDNISKGVKVA